MSLDLRLQMLLLANTPSKFSFQIKIILVVIIMMAVVSVIVNSPQL